MDLTNFVLKFKFINCHFFLFLKGENNYNNDEIHTKKKRKKLTKLKRNILVIKESLSFFSAAAKNFKYSAMIIATNPYKQKDR